MAIRRKFARHCDVALKRQKINRKISASSTQNLVDLPPGWAFVLSTERQESFRFDFEPLRNSGREDLAAHMRDAIWSRRHECAPSTLQRELTTYKVFMRFLDEAVPQGIVANRLADIDQTLVNQFVSWLHLQVGTVAGRPSFAQAWGQGTRFGMYSGIKAFLVNRQRLAPSEVHPDLEFPRNPFPNRNRLSCNREPYSTTEHERILAAMNQDLRVLHSEGGWASLPPLQVLAVHLLVLASVAGRNQQPLLELRRDSVMAHPLPDRELLVTRKRRGFSTHATSVRKAVPKEQDVGTVFPIPGSVGDHFRSLCGFTAPLAKDAGSLADYVFLWRPTKSSKKGQVVLLDAKNAFGAVRKFACRHNLLDDAGQPLALNVGRLRPTFAHQLYRRTGDIRRVQQALGHASARTTVRHYVSVPPEAERNHALVVEGMVGSFTRIDVEGKLLLAADGKFPLDNVKDLLAGGYSTGVARCRNPFRDEDSVCKKFFTCFKCPSMLVFEDDLWRLFSFYYRLLAERVKIKPDHWLKTYGPIIRRIDVDIASQFPQDTVQAARHRAQASPHPAWR